MTLVYLFNCRFTVAVARWTRSAQLLYAIAYVGGRLYAIAYVVAVFGWTGKAPQCRTRHLSLLSLSQPSVVICIEYPAKAGGGG